jgi:imidazoleglycerol-phosphate dehydratase
MQRRAASGNQCLLVACPMPAAADFLPILVPEADAVDEKLAVARVSIKNMSKMHGLLNNCLRATFNRPFFVPAMLRQSRQRNSNCNTALPLQLITTSSPHQEPLMNRTAEITRNTNETQIRVAINLDGTGLQKLNTGVPFLDHMLDQIARHGLIDLDIEAHGDLQIDAHHTVEDVGITLGMAVAKAIGDKKGIRRYGHAYVPLDEALSRVVLDFSGRPGLEYHVPFTRAMIGGFDVDLAHEFFQGFVNHALVSLHIDNLRGLNAHHQCETVFKAFGRALRMAAELDARAAGTIPSTKGSL